MLACVLAGEWWPAHGKLLTCPAPPAHSPHPALAGLNSPVPTCLLRHRWMKGDGPEADAVRNKKFKLIPRIVKGRWAQPAGACWAA